MADNHQKLSSYSGSLYGRPNYEGIEYDWEVPDNLVVASPGGVSSVHHHYTKGFNGRGNTSSDIYAGQGEIYNSGVYGNLYQTGQTATQNMGYFQDAPDYQYWQNQEPQQYDYSHGESATWAPSMQIYDQSGAYETDPKVQIEKYEHPTSEGSDFELLQPSDAQKPIQKNLVEDSSDVIVFPVVAPWILFLLFLFAFVAFDFWAAAGHDFVRQKFHKGGRPSWKQSLLYAVIVTAFFVFLLWLAGVPVTTFETL